MIGRWSRAGQPETEGEVLLLPSETVEFAIASVANSQFAGDELLHIDRERLLVILDIGNRVRDLRALTNWSLEKVLERIGCTGYAQVDNLSQKQLKRSLRYLDLTFEVAAHSETSESAQDGIDLTRNLFQYLRKNVHNTATSLGGELVSGEGSRVVWSFSKGSPAILVGEGDRARAVQSARKIIKQREFKTER